MELDIKILRMMWTLVEAANPYVLLKLTDGELIQQLSEQVEQEIPLDKRKNHKLSKYISARTPLIRELAYAKIG